MHWSKCIAEHKQGGSVLCVDPWEPYPTALEQMNADLEAGTVFGRFKDNIVFAEPKAPISYFVGSLGYFISPELFDVVFIDGDHTHEAVLEDLRLGATYLRDGGILCGDDLDKGYPGVVSAVSEFFGDVRLTNPSRRLRMAKMAFRLQTSPKNSLTADTTPG